MSFEQTTLQFWSDDNFTSFIANGNRAPSKITSMNWRQTETVV